MAIDWSHVALKFWGERFEQERLETLSSKDFKRQFMYSNPSYFRDADCMLAATRINNFGRAMREVGIAAMIEKRCRRW